MHLVDQIKARPAEPADGGPSGSYDDRMIHAAGRSSATGWPEWCCSATPPLSRPSSGARRVPGWCRPARPENFAAVGGLRRSALRNPQEQESEPRRRPPVADPGRQPLLRGADGPPRRCRRGCGRCLQHHRRRAACRFQCIGTAPGIKTVSSVFLMITRTPSLARTHPLLRRLRGQPEPNAQQLAEIAVATAMSCKSFLGVDARVAMLSFSTKGAPAMRTRTRCSKPWRSPRPSSPTC